MGTDRSSLERSCRRPNKAALGDRNTEMIGPEMYESFDLADVGVQDTPKPGQASALKNS